MLSGGPEAGPPPHPVEGARLEVAGRPSSRASQTDWGLHSRVEGLSFVHWGLPPRTKSRPRRSARPEAAEEGGVPAAGVKVWKDPHAGGRPPGDARDVLSAGPPRPQRDSSEPLSFGLRLLWAREGAHVLGGGRLEAAPPAGRLPVPVLRDRSASPQACTHGIRYRSQWVGLSGWSSVHLCSQCHCAEVKWRRRSKSLPQARKT